MVSKSKLAQQEFIEELAEREQINMSLPHATPIRRAKDMARFQKISSHTPVLFYFWSRSSPPCRFLGPVLAEGAGRTGDSVQLVTMQLEQEKDLKNIAKGGEIPFACLMFHGVWQTGYMISGGRGDDEVRIEIHLDQLPAGGFKDQLISTGLFSTLAAGEQAPEAKKRSSGGVKMLRATTAIATMGGSLALEGAARGAKKLLTEDEPPVPSEEVKDVAFYADLLGTAHGPDMVRNIFHVAGELADPDGYAAAYDELNKLLADGDLEVALALEQSVPTEAGSEVTAAVDPLDQLKKLSELHDSGVLSDEEFEAKKADLLDKI